MWLRNYRWEENYKKDLSNEDDSLELVKLCHLVDEFADAVSNLTARYTQVGTNVI